jgi:rhodanese-related sulfurtransferase
MNKYLTISLVFAAHLWLPHTVQAMTLERVNNDLYATGPTVDQDFLSFKEALAKGGIERLILVNGPGGDLWTGMRVAGMVRDANIKTVVSGYCMSACSLVFMAGQQRAFGTGSLPRMTMLVIQGAHDKLTKQVNTRSTPQMYALYKRQMGDKFDSDVINQALYEIKDTGGLLRIRELQRNQEKDQVPWFCPTGQTPFNQCQQHPGKDAYTLGIVTQKETETLVLPPSMQRQLEFYGRPLAAPRLDPQTHAEELIERACAGQQDCITAASPILKKFVEGSVNKAMAIGLNKKGYGASWSQDASGNAMLLALYSCNHTPKNPKLCRLASVNDHELLGLYEESDRQAQTLISSLKTVAPDIALKEREEPGTDTPSKLRPSRQLNSMTPRNLEGIKRLDTAQLVNAMTQTVPPVLIDVGYGGPMIPGAINLIGAGLVYEDTKTEADYAERFRKMMLAAAPDMQQPVVFYCASSECWHSVNAAMRAREVGYTQLAWYRGGIAAWALAGLPTVERAPVATLVR